jgi:hypothetical protein
MKRLFGAMAALGALGVVLVGVATAAGLHPPSHIARLTGEPTARDFADNASRSFGQYVTECPQAKYVDDDRPLQTIDKDTVWRLSERGDDLRFNYDLACVPQDETTIAINPRDHANMTGGANDYQGDYNQFDATSSGGKSLYGSILIQPSGSDFGLINSDPVAVYDRDGVAYNQEIAFQFDDANGVFVWRSTNGGFTWSRPCIPIENSGTADPDDAHPDHAHAQGVRSEAGRLRPPPRDVDALRRRRHRQDHAQLLRRPGPVVVAAEGDQRERPVLHRRDGRRIGLRSEPGLRADRAPEDRPAWRGVRELQHAG